MMPHWLEEIGAFLPLAISVVDADADGICVGGDRWRLRVNTNWRVSGALQELVGDEVTEVGVQSREVGLDLRLVTRTGRVFEILSDFPYGEWIFSVWRPGDERQVPIFDLEGPVANDLS